MEMRFKDVLTNLKNWDFDVRSYPLTKSEAVAIRNEFEVSEMIRNLPEYDRWHKFPDEKPTDRDWYLGIFKESDTGWVSPIPYICDYVGDVTRGTTKEGWILGRITDADGLPGVEYYKILECVAWRPLPTGYQK